MSLSRTQVIYGVFFSMWRHGEGLVGRHHTPQWCTSSPKPLSKEIKHVFWSAKSINGLDGKSCYTYRLVENRREGMKVRQKTLLNFGSNRDVPQSDRKLVAHWEDAIRQGRLPA